MNPQTGFLSLKLRARAVTGAGGRAVFAHRAVGAGELLAVWGGNVFTSGQLMAAPPSVTRLAIQVDEEMFLVSTTEGPADWINHSCSPNAGLRGQVVLVAMRDIRKGEQICYDYAMSDGSDYDVFRCECGSPLCRGMVTGGDWNLPSLQSRYAGFFSPYIERRIDAASTWTGRSLTSQATMR